MTITSPRLALARCTMRVAMSRPHAQGELMALSHELYRISDEEYERDFLSFIDRREALVAQDVARQQAILDRLSGISGKDSAA